MNVHKLAILLCYKSEIDQNVTISRYFFLITSKCGELIFQRIHFIPTEYRKKHLLFLHQTKKKFKNKDGDNKIDNDILGSVANWT